MCTCCETAGSANLFMEEVGTADMTLHICTHKHLNQLPFTVTEPLVPLKPLWYLASEIINMVYMNLWGVFLS